MLAVLIQSVPLYDAAWWLAALWFFRTLCLWSFFWGGCPCCGSCTGCSSSTPAQLQVEIPGVTNGGASNCASYGGTFVVDRLSPDVGAGCGGIGDIIATGTTNGAACQWTYVIAETPVNRLTVTIRDGTLIGGPTGNTTTRIFFWRSTDVFCTNFMDFERNTVTTPSQTGIVDCASLSSYEVPPSDPADPMRDGTSCNQDGSSALVTTL